MKSLPCESLSLVAQQILDYLTTHKDAQDTLKGIAEWWLLEQRIRIVITEVKKALAELVHKEIVLARKGQDGRVHYRLKPRTRLAVARSDPKSASRSPRHRRNPPSKRVENGGELWTG